MMNPVDAVDTFKILKPSPVPSAESPEPILAISPVRWLTDVPIESKKTVFKNDAPKANRQPPIKILLGVKIRIHFLY